MSTQKSSLIAEFNRTFDEINALVTQLDPNTVIHPDSGWRVHDLLGHLAVWYNERVKALSAYQHGEDYAIPDFDMDTFNHRTVEERAQRPFADIQAEWQAAHRALIVQLEAIPAKNYTDEIMYPWGARGPIVILLERLVDHACEHYEEFKAAAS